MAADYSTYRTRYQQPIQRYGNAAVQRAYPEKYYRKPSEAYKKKPAPEIDMKITPPKKESAPKLFLAALIAFALLFTFIRGKVDTNKMYRQISAANEQLEIVKSENVRLQSELESKMTLKNVEDYAVNVLGLQKLDNSQIEYVQTQTDDVVEIPEEEQNIFVKLKGKFNDFVEYIFG